MESSNICKWPIFSLALNGRVKPLHTRAVNTNRENTHLHIFSIKAILTNTDENFRQLNWFYIKGWTIFASVDSTEKKMIKIWWRSGLPHLNKRRGDFEYILFHKTDQETGNSAASFEPEGQSRPALDFRFCVHVIL